MYEWLFFQPASEKRAPSSPKKTPKPVGRPPNAAKKESPTKKGQALRRSSRTPVPVIQSSTAVANIKQEDFELTSPEKKSAQLLGVALRNLLKLPKAHKWVCYEFFYSNLDK